MQKGFSRIFKFWFWLVVIGLLVTACGDFQKGSAGKTDSADGYPQLKIQETKIVIPSNNNWITVYESGLTNEKTLIFIHGYTTASTIWTNQVKYFSDKWHTVCVDLPGHGASPFNKSITHDSVADDIGYIIDRYGSNGCVVVAHHRGCNYALTSAQAKKGLVKGLVLVNATLDMPPPMTAEEIEYVFDQWTPFIVQTTRNYTSNYISESLSNSFFRVKSEHSK